MSTEEEIKHASKERDFRRVIESVKGFRRWERGKGSHVRAVFEKDEREIKSIPYAAHGGEISPGVRRSFAAWLKAAGFIILLVILAYATMTIWTVIAAGGIR